MASLSIPAEPVDAPAMSPMTRTMRTDDEQEDRARRRQARSRNRERHRIIAACSGAVVTSLTMTPFDVVKTRLQTQGTPESLFIPSSHVPPPTQSASASASSAIPSSLKGKGTGREKAKAVPAPPQAFTTGTPLQHARSLAATNLATCCQKTYFTNNLAEKNAILCRFDPREGAVGSSSSSSSSSGSGSSGSGSRTGGVAAANGGGASTSTSALKYQPQASVAMNRRAVAHIPFPSMSMSSGAGGGGAAILSAEACLYPTPNIAAQHLPQLTLPSSRHFAGFVDAITKIVRYEGAPALWRGLSPSLVMSVPSQVIYMVGYDTLRTLALENPPARFVTPGAGAGESQSGRQKQGQGHGQPSRAYIASTTFAAGSVSRTGVAVLLAPLELFRTRLQSTVGRDVSLGSVVSSVRDLVRAEGVSSLWRGLSATLWRDVPFSGAYWAGYEAIRRVLSGGKGMGEVTVGEKAGKTFAVAFASGSGSGMIAAFLTHPFDVVKTRRQTEAASSASSRGTLRMLVELGRREGTAGLWRGMVPRVAKVAPACGIMIGAYEIGLRWAGEVDD